MVCAGSTGHAEAVKVDFDPREITYQELVERFWRMHDYTRNARQDATGQYRNAIFVANDEQERIARASLSKRVAERRSSRPVTTFLERLTRFWPAEEYHQRYYEKHTAAACRR